MSELYKNIEEISSSDFQKMYKIIEDIDQGTYGTVLKAMDKQRKQIVAIKKLIDNSSLATMVGEMKTMKKVNHKNILNSYGLFYIRQKSKYFLVTPYCQNGSLRKSHSQLNEKGTNFRIKVCLELARAINALHQQNIMHRDISPGNILFDEKWTVKLCDFGFSKLDVDIEQSENVGTQAYRDPNIRSRKYSKKCDIYSAGLVMDYIFRGHSVFKIEKDKPFETQYYFFTNQKEKIINQLNCPTQLKKIILKCLELDESNRLSARELLQQIQKLSQQYPYANPKLFEESLLSSINNIQSDQSYELQEDKKKRQSRLKRKFQQKDPAFVKMKTEYAINTSDNQIQELKNMIKNGDDSQIFGTQSFVFKKQSIQPLKISTKGNDNNKKFCSLVLAEKKNLDIMDKVKNFTTVYKFYLSIKECIRNLNKIINLRGIGQRHKKIIIFVGFFAYLRFIHCHRSFLLGNDYDEIGSIEGIKSSEMTPQTIDHCLELLEKETKTIKKANKRFLNQIYLQKNFSKHILTKNILEMLAEGKQKSYSQIQSFRKQEIYKQFLQTVSPEKLITKNKEQQKIREQLKQIALKLQ